MDEPVVSKRSILEIHRPVRVLCRSNRDKQPRIVTVNAGGNHGLWPGLNDGILIPIRIPTIRLLTEHIIDPTSVQNDRRRQAAIFEPVDSLARDTEKTRNASRPATCAAIFPAVTPATSPT